MRAVPYRTAKAIPYNSPRLKPDCAMVYKGILNDANQKRTYNTIAAKNTLAKRQTESSIWQKRYWKHQSPNGVIEQSPCIFWQGFLRTKTCTLKHKRCCKWKAGDLYSSALK